MVRDISNGMLLVWFRNLRTETFHYERIGVGFVNSSLLKRCSHLSVWRCLKLWLKKRDYMKSQFQRIWRNYRWSLRIQFRFTETFRSLWHCASRGAICSAMMLRTTEPFFKYQNSTSQERRNQGEDWFSRFRTREHYWSAIGFVWRSHPISLCNAGSVRSDEMASTKTIIFHSWERSDHGRTHRAETRNNHLRILLFNVRWWRRTLLDFRNNL
jgi:hypothetical protein